MCAKPDHQPTAIRALRERQSERPRVEPWRNTRPRGNPATDRRDLERSLERLASLVGR
jgi:hypothetical protein